MLGGHPCEGLFQAITGKHLIEVMKALRITAYLKWSLQRLGRFIWCLLFLFICFVLFISFVVVAAIVLDFNEPTKGTIGHTLSLEFPLSPFQIQ